MNTESSVATRMPIRILQEVLIGFPIGLIFTVQNSGMGRLGVILASVVFFLIGVVLFKLPPLWSRLSVSIVVILIIGIGIGNPWFHSEWPVCLWLCVQVWRGRYSVLAPRHYGLGFLICCAMLIVASQNHLSSSYKLAITAIALMWVVTWFVSLNRSLLEDAGLHSRIVTRPVMLNSRKYVLVFLTVALLIFAMTASYGKQLLTLRAMSSIDEKFTSKLDLPPQEQSINLEGMIPPRDQGPPSPIWNIVSWIMGGAVAVGVIWFIRLVWKDRTWSWRSLMRSIRRWFLKERRIEKLPYIEESRSLTKERKRGQGRFAALFHRRTRGLEWEELSNPEKVRRLYEEAVMAGIEQGYDFQAHHTPSETLERLEQWRTDPKTQVNKQQISYWSWLMGNRLLLLKKYESAKYSSHEIAAQDVEDLKKEYPK